MVKWFLKAGENNLMQDITLSISNIKEYNQLFNAVKSNKTPILSVGLPPVSKAQLAAALHIETGRPVMILTDDQSSAKRLSDDIATFSEKEVLNIPERDFVMLDVESSSHQYDQARITALWSLTQGKKLIVSSTNAISQFTIPPETLKNAVLTILEGGTYKLNDISEKLIASGYRRSVQVEGAGQFSIRGGILDIFPPQQKTPVRVEFWGDEIDSITYFDIGSQRRGAKTSSVICLPCAETLPNMAEGGINGLCVELTMICRNRSRKHAMLEQNLQRDIELLQQNKTLAAADKYLPLIYKKTATALDYLPEDTIILIDDTSRMRESSKGFAMRIENDIQSLIERGELPPSSGYCLSFMELADALHKFSTIRLDSFLNTVSELEPKAIFHFTIPQMNAYGGQLDMAASDISSYIADGRGVVVLCGSDLRCENMCQILDDHNITAKIIDKMPKAGEVVIRQGTLSAGFDLPESKLTILTEGQLIARRAKKAANKSNRDRVKSYTDLTVGDLVVHENHGIGRFVGMERIKIDGAERDYVKIAFAGTDFLYVPATNLDLISKYIGSGQKSERTKLNKLGGTDWTKAKNRAKAAAKDLAAGLIKLYAERARQKGFAFPKDDAWQAEFEQSFPYEETDDQLRCIEEIKSDMESDRPMDRLLCGDVGFGKTEVALRAVMKCILAGKQAAILVPTTVLARQHFLTAQNRFAGYPMKIELISRYKTASEQKKILEQLEIGMIDLIIGTHKLFNKNIKFKDLGLLVIDEEQRFGVSHKEKLKEISKQVDTLTLSATPIPRTLNMALSGIRDMSAIEEPPHDRHPVQTYVLEYNEAVVFDAIRRELARGGQVYYLHNIVEDIDETASYIQRKMPNSRIGIVHGKMSQRELTKTMTQMADGEIDILVCTTIIETGIDIANANTLIIENADHMGLAQLHQIRGRVGRSSRRAFAYLTYRKGKVLSEISQKRLSAIREFAEFGSGFKIAMRDLEIRGAGNILGPEQSGHMMSVGYDLYLKLLEEAVLEEKGETPKVRTECLADLAVSANLPNNYVPDAGQRVDLYHRIALIRSKKSYSDILDELIDRYGEPPVEAVALLDIALLRSKASKAGISEIRQQKDRLIFNFAKPDIMKMSVLCGDDKFKGRLLLNAGSNPYLSIKINPEETPLELSSKVIDKYNLITEKN